MAAMQRNQLAANQERVGKTFEVLAEGPSKSDPSRYTGRTRDYRIAVWPKQEDDAPGQLVDVEIDSVTALTLTGRRVTADVSG